jgi:hypothetical protein
MPEGRRPGRPVLQAWQHRADPPRQLRVAGSGRLAGAPLDEPMATPMHARHLLGCVRGRQEQEAACARLRNSQRSRPVSALELSHARRASGGGPTPCASPDARPRRRFRMVPRCPRAAAYMQRGCWTKAERPAERRNRRPPAIWWHCKRRALGSPERKPYQRAARSEAVRAFHYIAPGRTRAILLRATCWRTAGHGVFGSRTARCLPPHVGRSAASSRSETRSGCQCRRAGTRAERPRCVRQ